MIALFFKSIIVIVKRDFLAHFRNISSNFILFVYFITGIVFWAATLGRLVYIANYFEFLLVGLLILGVYNTSYNYMSIIGTEVRRGYVKYLLVLPVSRGGITVGRVLAGTIQGIVYVAILLGVTLVFLPWPSFAGFLMIFGTVACLSFCLSSLGIAIASYLRPALVDPVSDVLGLSLLFTSTIYYPPNIMPLQLKFLTAGNLLTAGADLVRAGFGLATISNSDVITLSLWTITFALLSIRGYYRQLEHLSLI